MYADQLDTDIQTFLTRHQTKDLLRFVSVGSVDDGKSTMIGRLLYDAGGVYEDNLDDARNRADKDGEIDFARLTDGLRAEREQGITIDVAYRYFTTAKRKFIIADTPGHIQYTRNMATGASTADLAIILIDARLGVLQQSRRHAYIASLLGIPHLLVAVNKMDLADFDQTVYDAIVADFSAVAAHLDFDEVTFLPMSALHGDNIVTAGNKLPWYTGPTLLEHLETVDIRKDRATEAFRYPVQYVIRPNQNYRGFAGQIASGTVRTGDSICVLPSGQTSTVKAIDTFAGEVDYAFAPMSVTIRLDDEIDVSRGDVITRVGEETDTGRHFDALMVWMSETPLDTRKSYLIKHGSQYLRAELSTVHFRIDLDDLSNAAADELVLNDIGAVSVTCHREIPHDSYLKNRSTGAFVVIDTLTNETVAAGMITDIAANDRVEEDVELLDRPHSGVSPRERQDRLGHEGAVVWMSGLPAAGKSTIGYALERRLFDLGCMCHVLDPEASGPDSEYEADVDLSGVARTAAELGRAGVIVVVSYSSALETHRSMARVAAAGCRFLEVHVATPIELCRARDAKGLYERADSKASQSRLPGAGADFETPARADVTVQANDLDQSVSELVAALVDAGVLTLG